MRLSLWSSLLMSGSCLAQGDLAGLLSSQEDLSTLLELVSLVPGLADTLAGSSNITIVAPTNEAFAAVPRNVPEGEAIEQKNDTIAIGALLANHVFKGVYPSDVITDIPTFAQTLLNDSYIIPRQPFSNFTGGQYNGIVKNGNDVCILSGEQTISTVTQADIKLGEGITIHKIDTVLSFGAPLQLFTYRAGFTALNAALEAADLGIDIGLSGADIKGLNISDFTIFVPKNEAFESIGSVLESADKQTLQSVLKYHIIPNNVIFSPSLGNVTVPSLQGANLTFTVLPDGSAWVNNAKIVFPNSILYNGIAHVIDRFVRPPITAPHLLTYHPLQRSRPGKLRPRVAHALCPCFRAPRLRGRFVRRARRPSLHEHRFPGRPRDLLDHPYPAPDLDACARPHGRRYSHGRQHVGPELDRGAHRGPGVPWRG